MAAVPEPAAPIADAEDAAELSHAPRWVPTILLHILYPDSRKVGLGWAIFIVATLGAFVLHDAQGASRLSADKWLYCVLVAGALVGGGTIADAKNEIEMAKVQASNAPAA